MAFTAANITLSADYIGGAVNGPYYNGAYDYQPGYAYGPGYGYAPGYAYDAPYGYGYGGRDWKTYAARNGLACTPGTWIRGEDGRRYLCQ